MTLFFYLLTLSFLFFNCSQPEPPTDTLVISLPSDPATLDPVHVSDLSGKKLSNIFYITLYTENGKSQPETIQEVSQIRQKSGTKIRIRFHGCKLPDGELLQPEDAIFSLNRLLTVDGPKKGLYQKLILNMSVNNGILELFVSKEYNYRKLLSFHQSAIYSKKQYELDGSFVSCGEYYLKKREVNNRILAEKNPYTIQNLPEKLEIKILPQALTGIFLFEKGRLDSMKLPIFLTGGVRFPERNLLKKKGKSVQYIAINNRNPCFNIDFRKGLNYAIDRNKILTQLFENYGEKTYASLPFSLVTKGTDAVNGQVFAFNPTMAMSLIEKSPCINELKKKGIELRMRGDEENKSIASVIAKYFLNVGIKVHIHPMEKAAFYRENGEGKGELTLLTWYPDEPGVAGFIDPVFFSASFGNGGNRSYYSNQGVDKLISKLRLSTSESEELEIALKILKELQGDPPWIYLWSQYETYLVSNKLLKYSLFGSFL